MNECMTRKSNDPQKSIAYTRRKLNKQTQKRERIRFFNEDKAKKELEKWKQEMMKSN